VSVGQRGFLLSWVREAGNELGGDKKARPPYPHDPYVIARDLVQ
jgi:hypothetical protein